MAKITWDQRDSNSIPGLYNSLSLDFKRWLLETYCHQTQTVRGCWNFQKISSKHHNRIAEKQKITCWNIPLLLSGPLGPSVQQTIESDPFFFHGLKPEKTKNKKTFDSRCPFRIFRRTFSVSLQISDFRLLHLLAFFTAQQHVDAWRMTCASRCVTPAVLHRQAFPMVLLVFSRVCWRFWDVFGGGFKGFQWVLQLISRITGPICLGVSKFFSGLLAMFSSVRIAGTLIKAEEIPQRAMHLSTPLYLSFTPSRPYPPNKPTQKTTKNAQKRDE